VSILLYLFNSLFDFASVSEKSDVLKQKSNKNSFRFNKLFATNSFNKDHAREIDLFQVLALKIVKTLGIKSTL
jgi:hypothetical protein